MNKFTHQIHSDENTEACEAWEHERECSLTIDQEWKLAESHKRMGLLAEFPTGHVSIAQTSRQEMTEAVLDSFYVSNKWLTENGMSRLARGAADEETQLRRIVEISDGLHEEQETEETRTQMERLDREERIDQYKRSVEQSGGIWAE